MIEWVKMANLFKLEEDTAIIVDGLVAVGLDGRSGHDDGASTAPEQDSLHPALPNTFRKENGLWQMQYDNKTVQLQAVKGFHDLVRLLAAPGEQVHCTMWNWKKGGLGFNPLIIEIFSGHMEAALDIIPRNISMR